MSGHASMIPSSCTGCHDPHGSASAGLIRAIEHEPFADRECDACHEEGQSPEELRSREICLICHDEPDPAGDHAPETVREQTCMGCHLPHAGDRSGLLSVDN